MSKRVETNMLKAFSLKWSVLTWVRFLFLVLSFEVFGMRFFIHNEEEMVRSSACIDEHVQSEGSFELKTSKCLTWDQFTNQFHRISDIPLLKSLEIGLESSTNRTENLLDLRPLLALTNLQELTVSGPFSIKSLPSLADLPLRRLDLRHITLSNDVSLPQVESLEELYLPRESDGIIGVGEIGRLRNLRRLQYGSCVVGDANAALSSLDKLEELEIEDDLDLRNCLFLTNKPLRRLSLSHVPVRTFQGMVLAQLENLTLDWCPVRSLRDLPIAPNLRMLTLYCTGIDSLSWEEVKARYPKIESVEYDDSNGEIVCLTVPDDSLALRKGNLYAVAIDKRQNRVLIVGGPLGWNDASDDNRESRILWEWKPTLCAQIPQADATRFGSLSECKRGEGGRTVLVASEMGGIAEVDVKSGDLKWYGVVGGKPQSLALLPDGRVVVASQDSGSLTDVDVRQHPFVPELQKQRTFQLRGAAGVEWDSVRKCLWAIGETQVVKFGYDSESMCLTRIAEYDFTQMGLLHGTDIWIGSNRVAFSTMEGVGSLNSETGKMLKRKSQRRYYKSLSYKDVCALEFFLAKLGDYPDVIAGRCGLEGFGYRIKGSQFSKARFFYVE